MPEPKILQGETATAALGRGFDQMANLLAVTLGPTQGVVLSKPDTRAEPEMLVDAATIARRIIAVPGRAQDVGAMIVRNLVWRMHVHAGDGCATAAVLAQAIVHSARRYMGAGGNPMLIRRGLDRAARAAADALRQMARPVRGESDLVCLAETITADPKLSRVLGEIYGKLGPDAHVSIEDYVAPYLERQFYEGGRWNGRLVSPYLISDHGNRRSVLDDCHVVLYAGTVRSVDDVRRMLEIVSATQWHQVALVAKEVSGPALGTLVLNHQQGRVKVLAAELRERESRREQDFHDLAVMTGATVLSAETGRSLDKIEPTDLGAAPHVQADTDELIVVGGEGDRDTIRDYAASLAARVRLLDDGDEEREYCTFRLARLSGQVAKLMIGAHTEAERSVMRQKAEKAIRALPIALRQGVVPGGGVAYLNCIPAVLALEASGDEAFGVKTIARALEEPFRRIAVNAGVDAPGALWAAGARRGADYGFDAVNGAVVSMVDAGIMDAAGVLSAALLTAVSGAVMALTTETIVLQRNPQTSAEP